MTAKTIRDLQGECCQLSCLVAGLEVLEWESYGDGPQAQAARGALRPIIVNLVERLNALSNALDEIEGRYQPNSEAAKEGAL